MFLHNGPMARHAYSFAVIERDKHDSQDFNQILLNDKDQQVLTVICALRAKFAIYDCLSCFCLALVVFFVYFYVSVGLLLCSLILFCFILFPQNYQPRQEIGRKKHSPIYFVSSWMHQLYTVTLSFISDISVKVIENRKCSDHSCICRSSGRQLHR